jgi:aryl-alcohol dehydrogenase-like predicted oxidoreductase
MNYIRLGDSGLKITELTFGSALTIGTENDSEQYAQELISAAWDSGIRSFDTSNNYGYGKAEILLGKALSKYPRQEFVLSTKGSWPIGDTPYDRGLSRKHILWAFEESIKRIGVDYIDIYYAHRYDTETPVDEVARTYNQLIADGKIRYWATSEWPLEALLECKTICEKLNLEKPVVEQFIYSYAVRKAETNGVIDYCRTNKVGMLGFSPLCQGLLTGKYKNGNPADSRISKGQQLNYDKTINFYNQNRARIDHFITICEKFGVSETAVALQWCIRKNIYPVFGASKVSQLIENVNAINVDLPDAIWDVLLKIE